MSKLNDDRVHGKVTKEELNIRKHYAKSSANVADRSMQPVINEETGEPKYTGRKHWHWKEKNNAPGPVTITKYKTEDS